MTSGLQIFAVNEPTPISAHTPIAKRLEMINREISPDSSARAPTLERPSSNDAPGIGRLIVNVVVHVLPTPKEMPRSDAHARYPKLDGVAHGLNHADAPIVI
jgi:hypothetical protein